MLFAALAPSLTRLMTAGGALMLAQVLCTARGAGASVVDISIGRTVEQGPTLADGDICPYCSLGAPPTLPTAVPEPAFALPKSQAAPVRGEAELPPSTAPPVTHPRGPPPVA